MMHIIVGAVFWLFSVTALAGEPRFFSELNDIPLMPGLYELTEETVIFDKPEGRIVETSAATETENINKIKEFYDSALPQLGWVRIPGPDGDSAFVRHDEALRFRLESRDGINVVKLMVSPR